MDNLYDTPEKINKAIDSFTDLLNNPGWILLVQIMDANIEVVRSQLENGIEGVETKADIDRIRDKLRLMRDFINTPQDQLEKLKTTEEDIPNDDPYDDVEYANA